MARVLYKEFGSTVSFRCFQAAFQNDTTVICKHRKSLSAIHWIYKYTNGYPKDLVSIEWT